MKTATQIKMKVDGSEELFAAPESLSEVDAVRWIARLYHVTADRVIKKIASDRYSFTNNRRGPARRGTSVTIVRD